MQAMVSSTIARAFQYFQPSTRIAICYATTSFSSAAIHNIFITYYINLFLTVFQLSHTWFFLGETVFLIWNSVNDPVLGWIMESGKGMNGSLRPLASKTRHLAAIKYGGMLWSFGFLVLFFPWSDDPANTPITTGLHFITSLVLYDGLLSWVVLAHSSLLADIAISHVDRAKCNMYGSIFGSLGSNSVFLSQLFWNRADLTAFRRYLLCLALVALVGFQFTASFLEQFVAAAKSRLSASDDELQGDPNDSSPGIPEQLGTLNEPLLSRKHLHKLREFLSQLTRHGNFWLFVGVNLVQVFNCHFNSNFFGIFSEFFLHGKLPQVVLSAILSLASLLPHLLVVFLTRYVKTRGVYVVLRWLFYVKLLLGVAALLIARSHWTLLGLYLLMNKSFSEAICRHGNLVVSDLVDEDFVMHSRSQSKSALLFGVNAFFTKPGQSLAPMLGWALLAKYGYRQQISGAVSAEEVSADMARVTVATAPAGLTDMMFYLLVFVPIGCALLQLMLWSRFDLHGKYLKDIKETRSERENADKSPV